MVKQVEHEGTVASICGNTLIVRILASSACGNCAAKGYCVPLGNKDREICVDGFSGSFVYGERVKVVMQHSSGVRALCMGYVIPFAVVLATLLAAYQITGNELVSGLSSLLILVPYYLILKIFNQRITKTFGFTVQKI